MEPEPVLESLRNAVAAMPDDVPLRLHLAALLLRAGQRDEAVRHLGAVLQRDPGNGEAISMLTAAAGAGGQQPSAPAGPPSAPAGPPSAPAGPPSASERTAAAGPDAPSSAAVPDATAADPGGDGREAPGAPADGSAPDPVRESGGGPAEDDVAASYDWSQAEDELRDVLPAMFVDDASATSAGIEEARAYDAEHAGLTLADVAGMTEVKKRLEAAFLAPMRNPELRRLYGKSLRGGRRTRRAVHHRVVRGPDRHVRRPV